MSRNIHLYKKFDFLMPIELTHSFNWLTSGVIDCRFFRNPVWIAAIITILILVIIPLTCGSVLWRGVFIYIASLIIVFMFSASVSRKINGAKEIEGAAGILGDLSYLGHNEGLEVVPVIGDDIETNIVNIQSDKLMDAETQPRDAN